METKNRKPQRARAVWNPPQRGPKALKEENEAGPGRREFVFCSGCGIVYYHKSWHHALEDWKHLSGEEMIKFVLCPACRMIQDKKFEGELTISGIGSGKLKEEIRGALQNSGGLAFRRDPLDRIIEIADEKNRLVVRTTENQLAVKLAKKIKLTFGGKMTVSHSREEDVIRAEVEIGR
jgi:NMD protein affecting ribosome stability and mRNA decay